MINLIVHSSTVIILLFCMLYLKPYFVDVKYLIEKIKTL